MVGPDRIAVDAPEFDPQSNQMRLDGRVLVALMPDWLGGVWQMNLPGLSGKIKVMPLPAWEPGGLRTSVWGGSMVGIPASLDIDAAHSLGGGRYALSFDTGGKLAEVAFQDEDVLLVTAPSGGWSLS